MDIKILGTGCDKCKALEVNAHAAVDDLGVNAQFEKVTDSGAIASWGVMATPALVIDDEVVVSGRGPAQGGHRRHAQRSMTGTLWSKHIPSPHRAGGALRVAVHHRHSVRIAG